MSAVVELKQPFWAAGHKYNWEYEDKIGFGVHTAYLNSDKIIIKSSLGEYAISGQKAKEICDKYNAYYRARNTKLAVIPREICEKI